MEVDKVKEYIQDAEKESMKKDIAIQKAAELHHGECQGKSKENHKEGSR